MDILFIADPLTQFKIYKDSTYAMMAEAARRAHVVYTCEPKHLAWTGGEVEANVQRVEIVGDGADREAGPSSADGERVAGAAAVESVEPVGMTSAMTTNSTIKPPIEPLAIASTRRRTAPGVSRGGPHWSPSQ